MKIIGQQNSPCDCAWEKIVKSTKCDKEEEEDD